MAYQEISSGATDIKKHKDKPYEGIYKGFKEITTKIGEQFIYNFENNGAIFGIYGFTTLNMAMQHVVIGSKCRVTYLGTKNMETKFGMKDVHICKVEVDDAHVPDDVPERDITTDYAEPGSDIDPFD